MTTANKIDLAFAHCHKNYEYLWRQAIPLVKLAVRRLMEDGRLDPLYATEDLLQDGYLAAGEAVRTWNPEAGAFSTWIIVKVQSKLLNSIQANSTGMVGGRKKGYFVASLSQDETVSENADDERKDVGLEASLVYDDPPETLGDPADEANRLSEIQYVHELLTSLPQQDRDIITFVYGEELTQSEAAELAGVSLATAERKLSSAKSFLRGFARKG